MSASTAPSVTMTRQYDATPDAVFAAWTDSALIAQWIAPGAMHAVVHQFEAVTGGAYSIEMVDVAAGRSHRVGGRFVSLEAPHRIVMSWAWQGPDSHESLVTITIAAREGGSEMTLLHERLPSIESAKSHSMGWEGCLAKLPPVLAKIK